jgi:hypothetical protein
MDGLFYTPARKIPPSLFFSKISISAQGHRGAEEKARPKAAFFKRNPFASRPCPLSRPRGFPQGLARSKSTRRRGVGSFDFESGDLEICPCQSRGAMGFILPSKIRKKKKWQKQQ